jgi:hypothetical protein
MTRAEVTATKGASAEAQAPTFVPTQSHYALQL